MEFWPIKINWSVYENELANGTPIPDTSRLEFECDDPEDTGSRNAALSDYFPHLRSHLPVEVCSAIGPLVGAIATCGIDGWPSPNDATAELEEASEAGESDIGMLYAPPTVAAIVASFKSVSLEKLSTSLSSAWAKKTAAPGDYQFSTSDHFENSDDFLEYLRGWYAAFEEASSEGHGVGIGGG